jgi:hypothetical protein
MARSSAKAEYRAMTSTASELTWIKQLLADLRIKIQESYIVTIKLHVTLHLIRCFTSDKNISKWIIISFGKKIIQRKLKHHS